MVTAFSSFLFAVMGVLAIPVLVLSVQVYCAAAPGRQRRTLMTSDRPRVAVLVPAHNEAAIIGETCLALGRSLVKGDRLLVVADNCSDETAHFAQAAGAEAIERHDPSKLGKGYALDYGVKSLADDPPDVLLVIDADCTLAVNALDYLARACAASQRPVQAVYSMCNAPGANLRRRIAQFAGIVKNFVRPLGYRRLGLPCMLMGTGMAFPWTAIVHAELATGHIVEDMKLGIDFASSGSAPVYCPEAEVASYFPDSLEGFKTQRTRWEHGHLSLIVSVAPRLVGKAIRERNGPLLAMALDLAVPPLALLAVLVAVTGLVATIPAILWGENGPLWAATSLLLFLCGAVAVAWARFARSIISFRELAFAPIYALLKLPLYLRFIYDKQVNWIRSARKGE